MIRVYTAAGKVAHLLGYGASPDSLSLAQCGTSPYPFLWRGRGTKLERAKAKELPTCKKCRRIVGDRVADAGQG